MDDRYYINNSRWRLSITNFIRFFIYDQNLIDRQSPFKRLSSSSQFLQLWIPKSCTVLVSKWKQTFYENDLA